MSGAVKAIGLMSGTSMDGVDAALLETDGIDVAATGPSVTLPYSPAERERIRAVLGARTPGAAVAAAEAAITAAHVEAVKRLLDGAGLSAADIAAIGFHGQTISHDPKAGWTWQIGDADRLARETGIDVVSDFRGADVAAGGEGAPFAPIYHWALSRDLAHPLAVLNVGGVSNVTWVGGGSDPSADLLAFDTGPGNALVDDWVARHTGQGYDEGGRLAAAGVVNPAALDRLLADPYFERRPPKSLDRLDFQASPVERLSAADGAATLTAFTAAAVARARPHLPQPPRHWLVTGGGRHNATLMRMLAEALDTAVEPVEAAGWDGDALEAQAFAYMAVRSMRGYPLSFPGTTGVGQAMPGGRVTVAA